MSSAYIRLIVAFSSGASPVSSEPYALADAIHIRFAPAATQEGGVHTEAAVNAEPSSGAGPLNTVVFHGMQLID